MILDMTHVSLSPATETILIRKSVIDVKFHLIVPLPSVFVIKNE